MKSHGKWLVAVCALIGLVELLQIGLVFDDGGFSNCHWLCHQSQKENINKDTLCCHTSNDLFGGCVVCLVGWPQSYDSV